MDLNEKFRDSVSKLFSLEEGHHSTCLNEPAKFQSAVRDLLRVLQLCVQQRDSVTIPPGLAEDLRGLVGNENCPASIGLLLGKAYALVFLCSGRDLRAVLEESRLLKGFVGIALLYGVISCLSCVEDGEALELLNQTYSDVLRHSTMFCRFYTQKLRVVQIWLENLRPRDAFPQDKFLALLSVITLHFETPLSGCAEAVREVLDLVCRIAQKSQSGFITDYVDSVIDSWSWNSKSKYLILAVMLPRARYCDVFASHCDLMYLVMESLKYSSLSSAGSELYRALVKTLSYDQWRDLCENTVFEALTSSQRTVQQNCINLWLPVTLQVYPQSLKVFRERLLQNPDNIPWLPLVSLLKIGRISNLAGEEDDDHVILRALEHGDDDVRMAALTHLTFSRKKTDPISRHTWRRIVEFVGNNLHVDNAQFRQNLQARLKLIVLQLLECSLALCKDAKDRQLLDNLDCVEELHAVFIEGLQAGASYQRKIACLSGLELLIKVFYGKEEDLTELAKGSTLNRRPMLMDLAEKEGKLQFVDESLIPRYLLCLVDDISEIADKSFQILSRYFKLDRARIPEILQMGLERCDSPKFQQSESGARILRLVHHWFGLASVTESRGIVEFFTDQIEDRFTSLKDNFLEGATSRPMHGFICAQRRVLQGETGVTSTDLEMMTEMAEDVVDFMLRLLSSKSKSEKVAPSFEEMGESINELARSCLGSSCPEGVSISASHQIILSCAWLNLKECAYLAAQIGAVSMRDEDIALIKRNLDLIFQILMRCRHKGAIEASADALGLLCRALLTAKSDAVRRVPLLLLEDFLQRLDSGLLCASVTRRSAGLSLLVAKVVSSEPAKNSRVLVRTATERLLSISQRPLPDGVDSSCDVPQSLALHILKSLVHDASLTSDLLWSLPSILRLSIDNFAHAQWSLRNAALQLYGSLVPRLVGPPRNRDSIEGSLSTVEFFHKFPELSDYLLEKLDSQSPGLVPTLGILSRLLPSSGDFGKFLAVLLPLLGHCSSQVRVLAAKSILSFLPLKLTKSKTMDLAQSCVDLFASDDLFRLRFLDVSLAGERVSRTNLLHGLLTCLLELLERCRRVALTCDDWEMLRQKCAQLAPVEEDHPCYYVRHAALLVFHNLGLVTEYEKSCKVFTDPAAMASRMKVPGFPLWLRLKTERILTQCPLNCLQPAMDAILPPPRGLDMVETGLRTLSNRLMKLSSSSVICNTLLAFINYYTHHYYIYPELLPLCMECIVKRGATSLLISDISLSWFVQFFIEECVEKRRFGTSSLLAALPALAAIVRDSLEKQLLQDIHQICTKLIGILYDAGLPTQPTSFRSSAAQSLQLCGAGLLKSGDDVDGHLILLILNLLQDEDRDVRQEAAKVVTSLGLHKHDDLFSVAWLSPTVCLQLFTQNLTLWYDALFLVKFLWARLSDEDPSTVPQDSDEPLECLFEQEAPNFYAEQVFFARLLGDTLNEIVAELSEEDASRVKEILRLDVIHLLQESSVCPDHKDDFPLMRSIQPERDQLSLCKRRYRLDLGRVLFSSAGDLADGLGVAIPKNDLV